nr:MAG TPA: hypothetical protein [Bacteriophage sp.]
MLKVTAKLQGDKCPCEIDMRGDPVQIIAETGYMLRGIYKGLDLKQAAFARLFARSIENMVTDPNFWVADAVKNAEVVDLDAKGGDK